ncbi:MAG: hypothetical protein R3185_07300 [Candidatus Thermoplasmatota archaeon]|nr:hypothetical protein [Candidatus Thermoplasmatota archaeon]
MRPNMVTSTAKITSLALATVLAFTGFAAAGMNPLAIATGEGGAQAAGEAAGAYHVDASGATDAAAQQASDAQEQARQAWAQSNSAYEDARGQAENMIDQAEAPATPQDTGEEAIFDQLDQASNVQASHTDAVEKAANLDTEYVDAGADLSAAASAKAWFSDAIQGLKDAYTGVKDQLDFRTTADQDAKEMAKQALHADDALRAQAGELLEEEQELPQVNPQASGELAGSHASELTSDVIAQGQAGTP